MLMHCTTVRLRVAPLNHHTVLSIACAKRQMKSFQENMAAFPVTKYSVQQQSLFQHGVRTYVL